MPGSPARQSSRSCGRSRSPGRRWRDRPGGCSAPAARHPRRCAPPRPPRPCRTGRRPPPARRSRGTPGWRGRARAPRRPVARGERSDGRREKMSDSKKNDWLVWRTAWVLSGLSSLIASLRPRHHGNTMPGSAFHHHMHCHSVHALSGFCSYGDVRKTERQQRPARPQGGEKLAPHSEIAMLRMHYSASVGSNASHSTIFDPFDQFGDPTDVGLPASGPAIAHRHGRRHRDYCAARCRNGGTHGLRDGHAHTGPLPAGGRQYLADRRQRHQPGTDRRLLPAVVDRRTGAVAPQRDHQHDPRQRQRHRDGDALPRRHRSAADTTARPPSRPRR